MILTVTPNTAVDRVLFFRNFSWGHTFRADQGLWAPGGKATDVSWILGELGQPSVATGLAAGEPGRRLQGMLEGQGATVDFVWVDGDTRVNYVLIDTAQGVQSTITDSGLIVQPKHIAALEAKLEHYLPQAEVLVLGGRVPPGMPPDWYIPWIRRGRERGIPVLLDVSGETLARCAPAGPTMLKPNLDELAELAGRELHGRPDALGAARELLTWGVELVLASLGAEGALAVTQDSAYYLPAIPVTPVNCAGAGDALTAGLTYGYAHHWPLEESLRLAVAAATAVVITPGTAECHRPDIERFKPQVQLLEP